MNISMIDQKLYEISYLLNDSLKEESSFDEHQKLKSFIMNLNGSIQNELSPKKRKLAYPVKKQNLAYFANLQFYLLPASLKEIEKKLKLEKSVLRHLITEVDKRQLKEAFKVREAAKEKFKKVAKQEPEEKTKIEELDKKLEEILKKI